MEAPRGYYTEPRIKLDGLYEFEFCKGGYVDTLFWHDGTFFWLVADFDHDVFDVAASIVIDGGGDFTFAASEDLVIIKSNSVLDIAFVGAFIAWHANSIEDGIVIAGINDI